MSLGNIFLNSGRNIYVETWIDPGKDKTLLFVHGGPGNGCWDYRYAAQKLSQVCNVIMYDQTGVLRSGGLPGSFASEMLVDEIGELLDYYHIDQAVLCAHSYGALLTLRYALKHPERVSGMIYICPTFHLPSSMRNVYQTCLADSCCNAQVKQQITQILDQDTLYNYIMGIRCVPPEVWGSAYRAKPMPQHVGEANALRGPADHRKGGYQQAEIFRETQEINKDYTPELPKVQAPSLLITGEFDPICTPGMLQSFGEKGTENRTVIISGGGHTVYCDCHADETVEAVTEFLQ